MPEDLDKVIERMRGEIDDLQIKTAAKEKPWYRDATPFVAALAFVFSLGTTFVSYRHDRAQEIENKRRELQTVLQRLAALPKENLDAGKTYADDPSSRSLVSGYINQENALLAHHAADLISKLPDGTVSGAEYQATASALQNCYDISSAIKLLETALKVDNDFNTEIAALRVLAYLRFTRGHPELGRVEYQRALDIFSKYPDYDPFTVASTNVWTELAWALAEANNGSLLLANQHVESAANFTKPLQHGPGTDRLLRQIDQARHLYAGGMPPASPASISQLDPGPFPSSPK